jgi:NTP pyrophosphatase (non-canonical NTP hydrolase)
MSTGDILAALQKFVAERDWQQFHSSENLAKSISIEAAELLELFQWGGENNLSDTKDELADVLTYCYLLANKYQWDPEILILEKLEKTRSKYPVGKSRGSSKKYDRL